MSFRSAWTGNAKKIDLTSKLHRRATEGVVDILSLAPVVIETFISKASARLATSMPIAPSRMPASCRILFLLGLWTSSSAPCCRMLWSLVRIWRATASSAKTWSATLGALVPLPLVTAIPRRPASSMSILSMPTPTTMSLNEEGHPGSLYRYCGDHP